MEMFIKADMEERKGSDSHWVGGEKGQLDKKPFTPLAMYLRVHRSSGAWCR